MGSAIRQAMTLVELIVAIALAMTLMAMSWTVFVRTLESTRRVAARVGLHESASTIREFLHGDLADLAPAVALFARSQPQVASGGDRVDTVELVFMRAPQSLVDAAAQGGYQQFKEDFHWVRWRFIRTWRQIGGQWKPIDGVLYRSRSTPTRAWTTRSTWATPGNLADPYAGNPDWTNYGSCNWVNLPRPLRSAAQGITSLDFNRYGIPSAALDSNSSTADIGDLADLDQNERVVSTQVRDFSIALIDARAQVATVASAAAADVRIDGLYMDVLGPAGNPYRSQLAGRPRVFRIAFSMADRAAKVDQVFAFSVAAPGLQPQIGR